MHVYKLVTSLCFLLLLLLLLVVVVVVVVAAGRQCSVPEGATVISPKKCQYVEKEVNMPGEYVGLKMSSIHICHVS